MELLEEIVDRGKEQKKNEGGRERDGTRSERKGDKKLVEGNCPGYSERGGWVGGECKREMPKKRKKEKRMDREMVEMEG